MEASMNRILSIPFPAPKSHASLAQRVVDGVLAWQERARQRHTLAGLDDYLLRDMGITRADVSTESGKPFWRA
jgi:uncharacterized protein YjiS (DUF1127 family)